MGFNIEPCGVPISFNCMVVSSGCTCCPFFLSTHYTLESLKKLYFSHKIGRFQESFQISYSSHVFAIGIK